MNDTSDIPGNDEIEAALLRVEDGSATIMDADLIRQYVVKLERELESHRRYERSINEALNSGSGAYIP